MNKTNLLLSTAVGLAFVVAGPSAMAVGKKHAPMGNAKAHAAVNFAKAPFKQANGRHGKPNHLKARQTIDTWGVTTVNLSGGFVAEDAATTVNCAKPCTDGNNPLVVPMFEISVFFRFA